MDICEQIASKEVIKMSVKYALRASNVALASKLKTIANGKFRSDSEEENMENHHDSFASNGDFSIDSEEENDISLPSIKKPKIEIEPLTMSETLKRINPCLKASGSPSLSPRGK